MAKNCGRNIKQLITNKNTEQKVIIIIIIIIITIIINCNWIVTRWQYSLHQYRQNK